MNYFDSYRDSRALLVEGVAGGGKSTVIASHAKESVQAGLRTLLITFSTSGAQVLQDYMAAQGLHPSSQRDVLRIHTIDGLALQILQQWGDQRYVLKKDYIVRNLLGDVLEQTAVRLDGLDEVFPSRHIHDLNQLLQDIDYFRASAAYRAEDAEEREYMCEGHLHFALPIVALAFSIYENLRERWRPAADSDWRSGLKLPAQARAQGISGFRTEDEAVSDLLAHPRHLDTPGAISRLFNFKYTLIDEFHDTTPLQFAFLTEICARSARIMAVGDKHQNIYGWRGADPELVFALYKQQFTPEVIPLQQSHRFGATLATALGRLTGSEHWQSLAAHRTAIAHSHERIDLLLRGLYQAQRLHDTAIICRDSSDLDAIGFQSVAVLAETGFSLSHNLVHTFASRLLTLLVALRLPDAVWPADDLRQAARVFLALPHCLLDDGGREEMLAAIVPPYQQGRAPRQDLAVAGNLRMYIELQLKQEVYTPALRAALQEWLALPDEAPLVPALRQFQSRAGLLKSAAGAARHAVASRRMIRSWEGLLDYLDAQQATLAQWPDCLERFRAVYGDKHCIRLLSVEQAKGREFDHVVVYGLNEGEFPARGEDERLERNRFYVAASRARQSLLLAADKTPGRFFLLWQ